MADTSRLRSAFIAAKGSLAAYPQSLDVTSRAGSSSEASVGISSGLYASLDNTQLNAAVNDAELRKFRQLMARRGVSDARKFAVATSLLRVYQETGMLQFIQELCCQLSSICSNFSRYSIRLRLTTLSWVQSSTSWTTCVLGTMSGYAGRVFQMLRDRTHGQMELCVGHFEVPRQTLHDLSSPPLLRALLGALPAVGTTMEQAVADVHSMHRGSSPMDFYPLYGSLVSSCARATVTLTRQMSVDVERCICRLHQARSNGPHGGSSSFAPQHLVPYITTQLDALLQTGWLSGLCAAVVDMPHPDARLSKRSRDRKVEARKLEEAMGHAHEAATSLHRVLDELYGIVELVENCGASDHSSARGGSGAGGRDGGSGGGSSGGGSTGSAFTTAPGDAPLLSPLLCRLCGMLLHPDVVRLQRAGLARLELHAGLGLGGGDDDSSSSGAGEGSEAGSALSHSGCAGGSGIGRGAGAAAEPYGECGGEGGISRGSGGTGAGGSGDGGMGATGGGRGGGGAAPGAAGKGSTRSAREEDAKHRPPQMHQGQAAAVGQQEEQGRGWAVTAHEAATGRLCTSALQREPLHKLEWVHLGAIHASLGAWRLLRTHRLWRLLPGHPGPGALPSVYDTARLSVAAARAMQRILYGEGSDIIGGRRWAGQATAPPAAALPYARTAVLPRAVTLLRDLAWGDLALRWEGLGPAEAQRCMPHWLEAGAVVLGMVAEAVEAGAGAGAVKGAVAGAGAEGAEADAATSNGFFQRLADFNGSPADIALTLLEALGCMLHGVPGGLPAAYRQLSPDLRTHSARRLHAARLLPTLDHLMRAEARGAFDSCAAQAASADPASAQSRPTVHGLVCRLLTGGHAAEPGAGVATAAWRWGLCDVRLQQGLRAEAVGLAVTAAKWGRRVAVATEELPLPPPPPPPFQAESACPVEQQAAAVASGRLEWVCQLRRALRCLSLLAVLVRVMLPALGEQQQGAGDEAGEGQRHGATGGEAAAAEAAEAWTTEVQVEALSLCLRVGCQLAAAALHAVTHHLQQSQGVQQAGTSSSREVLTTEEVYGAVGDALALIRALGVCAAEAPQLPPRQFLAAQPQRLVAACCEVWVELAAAGATARRHGAQRRAKVWRACGGGRRSGPKTAAATLGCRLGNTLACTLARLRTRPQLRPYLRAWLAPQAAVEAAAEAAEAEAEAAVAAASGGAATAAATNAATVAAAEYAQLLLAADGTVASDAGRTATIGMGATAGGSGGGGGSDAPGAVPWRGGVLSDAALLLLRAAEADCGGGRRRGRGCCRSFALLYQLREAARGGGGMGNGRGVSASGRTHQHNWEDACRNLHLSGGTSLRVATEEAAEASPRASTAPLPPVSPESERVWLRRLRAAAHVGTVGEAAAEHRELPHPLPPALGGAAAAVGYGGLRLCGNPSCGNFAGAAEAGLHLKHCAGCMAVRYCGADCQRAHWREGHRRECKALQAQRREEA